MIIDWSANRFNGFESFAFTFQNAPIAIGGVVPVAEFPGNPPIAIYASGGNPVLNASTALVTWAVVFGGVTVIYSFTDNALRVGWNINGHSSDSWIVPIVAGTFRIDGKSKISWAHPLGDTWEIDGHGAVNWANFFFRNRISGWEIDGISTVSWVTPTVNAFPGPWNIDGHGGVYWIALADGVSEACLSGTGGVPNVTPHFANWVL